MNTPKIRPVRRWEYLRVVDDTDILASMNDMGAAGWELVAVEPRIQGVREARYVFKRELP